LHASTGFIQYQILRRKNAEDEDESVFKKRFLCHGNGKVKLNNLSPSMMMNKPKSMKRKARG